MRPKFKVDTNRPYPLPTIALSVAGLLLASYVVGLFSMSAGDLKVSPQLTKALDCSDPSYLNLPFELKAPDQNCPNVVETVVNFSEINLTDTPRLIGAFRLWPAGELGAVVVNSGVAQRALDINYENLGETSWQIAASEFVGSRVFAIPLNNNGMINSYPFDRYEGTWLMSVADFQSSGALPTTATVSSRPIYGWSMEVSAAEQPNDQSFQKDLNLNGVEVLQWSAIRSSSVKISALLLIIVILVGIFSAVILTISILRKKRPPTLSALGWLATSLFAIIEIRSRFPGDPPPGILLDKIITYPVTTTLLGLILTHTFMWIKRDDWDMKNTPNERSSF
jgi:hypothetical protein